MLVIRNENVDPYDIDGTLIMHDRLINIPDSERVRVVDPVTGGTLTVRINRPMVRLLMESKARGSYVIVWSRGGFQWAENVIKALSLTAYVDQVMSKPMAYFDDTPIEKWLPYRVMIQPNEVYKSEIQPLAKGAK